jgi:hypothetical protein
MGSMRRFGSMATLILLLAGMPLWAQHGGGHASAGGHGGMAAHGSFGGHASGGMRFGAGVTTRSFSGSASHRSFSTTRTFIHSGNVRIRTYGLWNNCYGCRGRYGYPWWYAGSFDPYWWWNSGSSYDADKQREIGLANEMNAQSLEEQRMRQQGDQDVYARSAPPPPRAEEITEAAPATVLVFRDQRKQEVRNYAIVGQTLWNFAPQHTEKISLGNLDLAATTKANDERGVDFRVPGGREGQ